MRVFVTGAAGFVGSAVVSELVGAGHEVVGLARSEGSAKRLGDLGARVHRGSIEDLDGLRRAASEADGAVHTAFYHAIGHMPLGARLRVLLGGGPVGIPMRFVEAAVTADRRALAMLGEALGTSGRPLVAAFATLAMRPGATATEDESPDASSAGGPRGENESLLRDLAAQGVRTSVVRLPPLVHGRGDRGGLTPQLIRNARKKGESAYPGDGGNRWAAVHRLDAARLFRLALGEGRAGGAYHAVAEAGIPCAASLPRGPEGGGVPFRGPHRLDRPGDGRGRGAGGLRERRGGGLRSGAGGRRSGLGDPRAGVPPARTVPVGWTSRWATSRFPGGRRTPRWPGGTTRRAGAACFCGPTRRAPRARR